MLSTALAFVLAASTPTSIDVAELSRRSEATTAKISNAGARYFLRQKLGSRVDLAVHITQFGNDSQFDFVTMEGDKETPFFTLTALEHVWIMTVEAGKPIVQRPWEVFLPVMSAYLLIAKSSLSTFHPDANVVLVRETATTSTWATPRDPKLADSMKALVAGVRALTRDAGGSQIAELEQKLKTVPLVEVDNATGLVLHVGPDSQRGLFFSKLELLTTQPELFKQKPPTPPPALDAKFTENALIVGWDPMWRPGDDEREPDAVLINFDRRAERRRVPNQYGLSFQGTFLSPRSKIVVTTSLPTGGFRPLLVDLTTGENRLLGDGWGPLPVVMFPSASPDGKKVAVLAQDPSAPLMQQLQVIDVATNTVTNIGAPADQVFVNWLPDGFILVRRLQKPGAKEPVSRIVRLSADGKKETELISNATRPVVVAHGTRLLYKDLASNKWHTSDLKGKQVKLLGDGLPTFFQPTASPDGEVVLMLTTTPAVEARMVIVETGEVLKADLGSGRWSDPQWR
jgi:hypothetical protein